MNPFQFHTGIEYIEGKQHHGRCVFCDNSDAFHFDPISYRWDCKSCQKHGNLYTFLQLFHARLLDEPVSILAEERGIPVSFFQASRVRYNQFLSSETYHVFCIPTYNKEGALNNLYKVIPNPKKPGKRLILCTPTLSPTLFNFPNSPHKKFWLLEGHWDKLAGEAIVGTRDITCSSWPGAAFKPGWERAFAGCDLCILQDKDKPNPQTGTYAGEEELARILKIIKESSSKPKSIRVIKWPDSLPEKFDTNDAWKLFGSGAYDFIEDNLVEYEGLPDSSVPTSLIHADESCDTFEKLLADAASTYYFTHDMELLLLSMITSIYSLRIDGEQVWLRIMGPPGSAKTTIAKIIGSSERTIMRDTFTGLLSGWKDDNEQDASMIPLIADRALIVKDADAILQQPNVQQIMSELRAFYDKQIAVTFRNRVSYSYADIRSSFIFCGTHTLRDMDNTSLGERFLDFELHVTEADRQAISRRVLENQKLLALTHVAPEVRLFERAKGFIDTHLSVRTATGNLGPEEDNVILQYGSLISFMRATVSRDYKGRLKHKPYPEVPSRIVAQIAKVFLCAPTVFNSTHVPPIVHDLVRHHTRDIINVNSLRYKVCHILHTSPGISGDKIVEALHPTPPEVIAREIENMSELGMVDISQQRTASHYVINIFALKDFIHTQFGMILDPE